MRIVLCLLVLCVGMCVGRASAQAAKPFVLPVAAPPGPSTWLFGQPYGNTVGAYLRGSEWYEAGQQLHFGLDFSMPCGTPLVAVADGTVGFVDDMGFGSGPHNLILIHPQAGLTTLYGHLLQKPDVQPGAAVKQGDVVALSGDPDSTCDSRPHLHFEVRSPNYSMTYNPVEYIDTNWQALTTIGSYSTPLFEQDLDNAARWMSVDDQPAVTFWGRALNNYAAPYPDYRIGLPPANPPLEMTVEPLPLDWSMRRLTYEGCCATAWWGGANQLLVIDGSPGQRAAIFAWNTDEGSLASVTAQAPPPLLSPDGSLEVQRRGDQAVIRRLADGAEWTVSTGDNLPAISTDNRLLVWAVTPDSRVADAATEIWVSDVDGANAHVVVAQPGAAAQWLDDARLLVSARKQQTTTLAVVNAADGNGFVLGAWDWLRGLTVAPGGGRLMFYIAFQPEPADDGVYAIETQAGAQAEHLPFFGAWRWRDPDTVYYLPFDGGAADQQLHAYDLTTGDDWLLLETPIHVANGNWSASPDGDQVVFWNADDRALWVIDGNG